MVYDAEALADGARPVDTSELNTALLDIATALQDDVDTPKALEILSRVEAATTRQRVDENTHPEFVAFLEAVDALLGLKLAEITDITEAQKTLKNNHDAARVTKDWAASDDFRKQLEEQGIGLKDLTDNSSLWFRLNN